MKEWFSRIILKILSFQENPSVVPWSLRQIGRLFQNEPRRFRNFLDKYRDNDSWFHRFFVGHQAGTLYPNYPEWTLSVLEELSRDENDMVLEATAHGWSQALTNDFDTVFDRLTSMAENGNYRERRTSALAPVEYYRDGEPDSYEKEKIESFWYSFSEDSRQGLVNLVETQILDKIVNRES